MSDTPESGSLGSSIGSPEYFENINPDPADFIATYKPDCIQKTGNFASTDPRYSFESGPHHHRLTREILSSLSPKCLRMIEEIESQDEEDYRTHGRLFKHFIYSSVKSTTKVVATAFMDVLGLRLGYGANYLGDDVDKKWSKIQLLTADELDQNRYGNLYLLSSVNVLGQPISVPMRKEILKQFNTRPDNSHGELARFIVMDSGFKEGIDLFDIKYVHIFEPQMTGADLKQIIGRGTRMCGQKGLDFHPTRGWPLHVNIYDSEIPEEVRFGFEDAATVYDLYMKALGLDVRLLNLATDMERMYIEGAVDRDLNAAVHSFALPQTPSLIGGGARFDDAKYANALKQMPLDRLVDVLLNHDAHIKMPETHEGMRDYIRENYAEDYTWPEVVMENKCGGGFVQGVVDQRKGPLNNEAVQGSLQGITQWSIQGGVSQGGASPLNSGASPLNSGASPLNSGGAKPLQFTPTQDFVRMYMTPELDRKGVVLIHSTGSGKTCTAIATATSSFEEQGYTILWVTRTTLRADIWKNMFDQVCNESIRTMVRLGVPIPADQKGRMRLLSKAWSIRPMSYKQFSNMVLGKNEIYKALVKRNGAADPLRKTLIIIDEAHKLYGEGGLSAIEKPDMNAFSEALMRSYEVSGSESVRLLIMTATPITTSPMEFVKLLNLCKERFNRIEDSFELFAETYLDETGMFSAEGRARFLDEMSGHVSYLNREKDARTFAQPIVRHIVAPILHSPLYRDFDPRIMNVLLKTDTGMLEEELRAAIEQKNTMYENVKAESFTSIKSICEEYADNKSLRTACTRFANEAIKEIMEYIKGKREENRDAVKELRERIADFKREKTTLLKEMRIRIKAKLGKADFEDDSDSDSEEEEEEDELMVRKPIPDFSDDFNKYNESTFNAIKTKCKDAPKRDVFNAHPGVVRANEMVVEGREAIKKTVKMVKSLNENLKEGEKELRNAIRMEKDIAKRAALRQMLAIKLSENKSVLIESRKVVKYENKNITQKIKDSKKDIKKLKRSLEKKYKAHQKDKLKQEKEAEKDAIRLKEAASKVEKGVRIFTQLAEIEDAELREVVNRKVNIFINKLVEQKAIYAQKKPRKTRKNKSP
jgi:broad-specificity NMP kinase